ncbi:YwiC-like family protein [Bacillus hominis]|uniref:YwiC-like family protein n=1 Tax=Bacillus hominis TaxID=2817478 RepID=A0ABT7R992_9BACI|nr:YwiC-like family protein [Bacillus hominis]MDM5194376.1 YwiC-like family protein [Bacillus hominis]MDM5434079.1 YwiC-like family protein [Bacillus hominis]MDM5439501.1 YwiC-like family protein [Bacillus hominis]
MKLVIPKQHGAWAMLVIPFLLSVILGNPTFYHIPLFLAWFFIYLATYPFLMYIRQRRKIEFLHTAMVYSIIAFVFGMISLLYEWRIVLFAVLMLPLFIVNMYYARQKNERALLNDICAIIVFCIGGLISYYFSMKQIDKTAVFIALISFLYFLGSTFYVKTMIREKNNPKYRFISWGYHIVLTVIVFTINPWCSLIFVPSVIRAIILYGRKISILKVGILEIVNSVYFLIITVIMMKYAI